MVDILFKYDKETLGVLTKTGIAVGDNFYYGKTQDGKAIERKVAEVIEQRPSKGVWPVADRRKIWAKIKFI